MRRRKWTLWLLRTPLLAPLAALVVASCGSSGDSGEDAPEPGWSDLASLPLGVRQEHPTIALAGEVVVIGGLDGAVNVLDTMEAYDPAADAWRTDVARLPAEMHHANAAVVGERLWITGFLEDLAFAPNGGVFSYDPEVDRWDESATMPAGTERGASAVGVLGERILVAGGLRGGTVADFSAFDPASDTWEPLADLPEPRDHAGAGVVDGIFYVLGGRANGITSRSAAVFAWDPETRAWSRRADMPTARGGVASAVLNGRIYVFGGEGNRTPPVTTGVFPQVEVYDPASDSWESLPPMPHPRHGLGAAALGGRIFLPGGADREGFGPVSLVDALVPDP